MGRLWYSILYWTFCHLIRTGSYEPGLPQDRKQADPREKFMVYFSFALGVLYGQQELFKIHIEGRWAGEQEQICRSWDLQLRNCVRRRRGEVQQPWFVETDSEVSEADLEAGEPERKRARTPLPRLRKEEKDD